MIVRKFRKDESLKKGRLEATGITILYKTPITNTMINLSNLVI